eukprot:194668_1
MLTRLTLDRTTDKEDNEKYNEKTDEEANNLTDMKKTIKLQILDKEELKNDLFIYLNTNIKLDSITEEIMQEYKLKEETNGNTSFSMSYHIDIALNDYIYMDLVCIRNSHMKTDDIIKDIIKTFKLKQETACS